MIKIKSYKKFRSQLITEGKEQDQDPKAVYIASEVELLDKAETNVESGEGEQAKNSKGIKDIDKQKKDLLNKYKAITGHEDTKKSIPEAKDQPTIAAWLKKNKLKLWTRIWEKSGNMYDGLFMSAKKPSSGYDFPDDAYLIGYSFLGDFDTESEEYAEGEGEDLDFKASSTSLEDAIDMYGDKFMNLMELTMEKYPEPLDLSESEERFDSDNEDVNEAKRVIQVYEGLMEDLGIKDIKELPTKYASELKDLAAQIGGAFLGVFYDAPSKSIGVATPNGIGYYYFDPEQKEFEQYKITPLIS